MVGFTIEMKKIIGLKKGMTQIFVDDGVVPVTVVEIPKNKIFLIRSHEGKNLFRIGIGKRKKMNKPEAGLYKEVKYSPRHFWDVWVEGEQLKEGDEFGVETLEVGDLLKIAGISKGKGFAGVVKRHGFHGGPKTHGQSDKHRAPGTIGAGTEPGRVVRGRKMAGKMGGETITEIKRKVVDIGDGFILVSGALPGNKGGVLKIEVIKKK